MKRLLMVFLAIFSTVAQSAGIEDLDIRQLYRQMTRLDARNEVAFSDAEGLAEFKRRGEESIRFLMDHAHIRTVWPKVYLMRIVKADEETRYADALIEYLDSDNPLTRRMALLNLSYYEIPDKAHLLLPHLGHEKTLAPAIRGLGKWKAEEHVNRLLPFLKHEKEEPRVLTANALGSIGDPVATSHLLQALEDPYFTVRYAAARALVRLGTDAGKDVLKALNRSDDEQVTRHLIHVLGAMKYAPARRTLRKYLKHESEAVQRDAFRALADMERDQRDSQAEKSDDPFMDLIHLLAEEPDTLSDYLGVDKVK